MTQKGGCVCVCVRVCGGDVAAYPDGTKCFSDSPWLPSTNHIGILHTANGQGPGTRTHLSSLVASMDDKDSPDPARSESTERVMGKVPRVKASCVEPAADGGKWRSPLGQGSFEETRKSVQRQQSARGGGDQQMHSISHLSGAQRVCSKHSHDVYLGTFRSQCATWSRLQQPT